MRLLVQFASELSKLLILKRNPLIGQGGGAGRAAHRDGGADLFRTANVSNNQTPSPLA
jgi:hypothetical protein